MGAPSRTGMLRVIGVVLCFGIVLSGTAVADALTPPSERGGTGEEVGRAGFAYLTGVRTFAAAVLWNRIEPLFHDYYEGTPLVEQTYMLPTVRMVVALDPQLHYPYYVAAWMLTQHGEVGEGVQLAREGVENNPTSGLLRASYAQILWLVVGDVDSAAEQARSGLDPGTEWTDLAQQYEAYVVFRDVLRAAGDESGAQRVADEAARIDREIHELGIDHDIDHDH